MTELMREREVYLSKVTGTYGTKWRGARQPAVKPGSQLPEAQNIWNGAMVNGFNEDVNRSTDWGAE